MGRATDRLVVTDAQLGDQRVRLRSARGVLLVGTMPDSLVLSLDRRGATLSSAATLSDAFVQLEVSLEAGGRPGLDVVALDPHCDGHALDFLHALKEPEAEHLRTVATLYGAPGQSPFLRGVRPPSLEGLERLRRGYEFVPFVLLPDPRGREYSVVVKLPDASEVRAVQSLPVATTLMSVTAAELLSKSSALA